ncbi:hypothetical protein [Hydrogenophaga intermedia]|uniref:hypothetical protein n=1 Tax=Hydrogenophaga intermedia TaxID=65786 RepID=UPI0020440724|nr:hypothetical protein [Hydrogenophaga intermedia]MCM3562856.1 hypothetical protein [Hydrogenophaga intermedia]
MPVLQTQTECASAPFAHCRQQMLVPVERFRERPPANAFGGGVMRKLAVRQLGFHR